MGEGSKENRLFPPNVLRCCIDQWNPDIEGRVYSKLSRQELVFHSFVDFLLCTDDLFDQCGYPQSFVEKRGFFEKKKRGGYLAPKIVTDDNFISRQRGKESTVDIMVRSRRKAGWQGYLLSQDRDEVMEFHSEIELMRKLDEIMEVYIPDNKHEEKGGVRV